ncbi:N-acetylmuramoyl-L-alanine amidase [Bacillus rubiinfantis]|uniref:N-acetylmuramoyl-L-alanine amidase n=1 Tax=Bacillus rubiinfantis TaxID=1499680 RepID=UPI000ACBC1EB
MKLYLDPGHGGQDPGAQGNGLDEKDITLDIALRLRKILLTDYENVEVKMSRTTDKAVSLSERTSEANKWGADFFLAIHINSNNRTATGYEDYIYSGLASSSTTAKYQNMIHAEIIKVNGLKDRGKKQANFHVLRESSMPALLTENGFIDNEHDAALMKKSSWLQDIAQGHANGLAKAFGLKKKEAAAPKPSEPTKPAAPSKPGETKTETVYNVMVGSFKSKENADERVAALKKIGFKPSVVKAKVSGVTWYRVQVGTFSTRAKADALLNKAEKAGYDDSFIVIETVSASDEKQSNTSEKPATGSTGATSGGNGGSGSGGNSGSGNSSGNSGSGSTGSGGGNSGSGSTGGSGSGGSGSSSSGSGSASNGNNDIDPVTGNPDGFTILGPTFLSPQHMNTFVKTINPKAPELGSYYLTLGEYYGIRGDVAFAQAILETDYFRFTGDVGANQNNYAGLGATGSKVRGASFATPEEGVIAHLQHLFAYATTKKLPSQYPLLDPRFSLVERGSAPTWVALNGKWAVPGRDYGQTILDIYERMIHTAIQHLETTRKNLNQ